jgi:hypothetical protein
LPLRLVLAAALTALAAGPSTAQEPAGLAIEVGAAWAGRVAVGRTGEIVVRVTSTAGGLVRLSLPDAKPLVTKTVRVAANVPATAAIALRVGADPAVRVRAIREDGIAAETTARPFLPVESERPVAAAVSDPAAMRLPAGMQRLNVAPEALPRTPQAYDAVLAVVVDGAALARLDAGQRAALALHLADCGRVVATRLPAEARTELRALAGCGGAFLATPEPDDDLAATVAPLLAARLPPVADPGAAPRDDLVPFALLAFLGAYLALIAAAMAMPRAWPLFAIPAVAAALAVAVGYEQPPRIVLAVEAQAEPGAATARYRARATITGAGRAESRVAVPAFARLIGIPHSGAIELDDSSPWATVVLPGGLGRRDELRWDGPATLPAGLARAPGREPLSAEAASLLVRGGNVQGWWRLRAADWP